jgi:hypothetical protein
MLFTFAHAKESHDRAIEPCYGAAAAGGTITSTTITARRRARGTGHVPQRAIHGRSGNVLGHTVGAFRPSTP